MSVRSPVMPTKKSLKENLGRNHRQTHGEDTRQVNQNIQDALKKFQDTKYKYKYKEHEKTQIQINKLRENFNKHQSETKDTIKKRDLWIKEDNPKYKRGVEQRYGKPQRCKPKRYLVY
jgi:Skp family chaperone for outer membrane proteins